MTEPQSPKDQQYDRFVAHFARNEHAIRGYVRSLLPTAREVDDVMQEVGLVCWRKFETFEESGSAGDFTRWACVVARFEALRYRRNYARDRLVLSEEVINLLADDAEQRFEIADVERQAVETCLQKLSDSEQRLLLSVHTPGDSIAQIAGELGQNARRLYSRLNALRELISECVRKQIAEGEMTS